MTLGLPQACKLWIWVGMGMLPVKHLAPKILNIMAVNYCGRQLDCWLTWAAPVYHKKEGVVPHPGAYVWLAHLLGILPDFEYLCLFLCNALLVFI